MPMVDLRGRGRPQQPAFSVLKCTGLTGNPPHAADTWAACCWAATSPLAPSLLDTLGDVQTLTWDVESGAQMVDPLIARSLFLAVRTLRLQADVLFDRIHGAGFRFLPSREGGGRCERRDNSLPE